MSTPERAIGTGSPRAPGASRTKERLRLTLEDVGYLGECVGRAEGLVVFAAYGLPGEEVVVEVDERKRRYVRGRVVEVLQPSAQRRAAPCPLYGACGGCSWQHVDYASELTYKETIVAEQLQRIAGFGGPPVGSIIASASPWRYRNQGRFSSTRDGQLGLTRRRSRSVLPVEDCLLMQEPIVATLARLQRRVSRLHQVVIRCGARNGSLLVAPRLEGVADLETGQAAYEEDLLGHRFRVSAYSFFQTNTRPAERGLPASLAAPQGQPLPADGLSQADVLALIVLDRLALTGTEVVLDAFCGVGTFALLVADRAKRVIGIEESRCAIADAEHNRRGLSHVRFHGGKVEEVLPQLDERFDAAILDPARVGCAPSTLVALLAIRPPKVVYVSCDPATLARDLKLLCESAYDLVDVQPIDMFPRTHHVEVVATLAVSPGLLPHRQSSIMPAETALAMADSRGVEVGKAPASTLVRRGADDARGAVASAGGSHVQENPRWPGEEGSQGETPGSVPNSNASPGRGGCDARHLLVGASRVPTLGPAELAGQRPPPGAL